RIAWQIVNRAAYCESGGAPALPTTRRVRCRSRERDAMTDDVRDHLAIQKLLADYCLYLDESDFESWGPLFTPNAQVHAFGQIWDGRDEIVSRVSSGVHGLHMAGMPLIVIDGNHATSRQNFQFL